MDAVGMLCEMRFQFLELVVQQTTDILDAHVGWRVGYQNPWIPGEVSLANQLSHLSLSFFGVDADEHRPEEEDLGGNKHPHHNHDQ